MELFTRSCNDLQYIKYKKIISKYLNINNVLIIKKSRIKKMFSVKNEKYFLKYRFELVNEWIKVNFMYTMKSVLTLESIIKKLIIKELLNPKEIKFISDGYNVAFAKKRNLKSVLNDLDLPKNEYVYYIYPISSYSVNNVFSPAINIYFSNKQIYLIKDTQNIENIKYNKINSYHLNSDSIEITLDNKKYLIYCADPKLIYVSFERMLRILNKQ